MDKEVAALSPRLKVALLICRPIRSPLQRMKKVLPGKKGGTLVNVSERLAVMATRAKKELRRRSRRERKRTPPLKVLLNLEARKKALHLEKKS